MQNTRIFSQFDQKNSKSEYYFLVVFNNNSIFLSTGYSFFQFKVKWYKIIWLHVILDTLYAEN